MTIVVSMPADLKAEWEEVIKDWLSVARRCQQMGACEQEGYAVIRMAAIVDCRGRPVVRTEPKMTKLEPKNKVRLADLQAIADFCAERDIPFMDVISTLSQ